MSVERLYTHIVLEDLDYSWDHEEVEATLVLWTKGWAIIDISKTLVRDPDEIAVLLLDISEQSKHLRIIREHLVRLPSNIELGKTFFTKLKLFLSQTKYGYVAFYGSKKVNFFWCSRELRKFKELWHKGVSIEYMVERFKRKHLDITLLIMDQARIGEINPRKGGAKGREVQLTS